MSTRVGKILATEARNVGIPLSPTATDHPRATQGGLAPGTDTTWLQKEDPSLLDSILGQYKQRLCFGTSDLCILGSTPCF